MRRRFSVLAFSEGLLTANVLYSKAEECCWRAHRLGKERHSFCDVMFTTALRWRATHSAADDLQTQIEAEEKECRAQRTTVKSGDRNDAPKDIRWIRTQLAGTRPLLHRELPPYRTNSSIMRTLGVTDSRSGCMRPPAASVAPSPAEHRESVLLGKRRLEARCVGHVVVAEHRGFAGRSLGTCGPDLC